MKVISTPDWLTQDIFDVFHMFLKDSKYDEEKPFVNFIMQQNHLRHPDAHAVSGHSTGSHSAGRSRKLC